MSQQHARVYDARRSVQYAAAAATTRVVVQQATVVRITLLTGWLAGQRRERNGLMTVVQVNVDAGDAVQIVRQRVGRADIR